MSPERKMLARTLFKLKVHEANGYSYEHLFASVMQYARPDLVKIKPYGNQGDRGNDAYQKNHGRYFQMFAPEDPKSSKQEAIEKVQKDFKDKLLPYWGKFCAVREYIFVFNDKYFGTNFPIEETLSKIKADHLLDIADVFLAKDLEQEFICLAEDQILMIISGLPDPESLEGLDYGIVNEVIQHIQNSPPDDFASGKLIAPDIDEKIKFNQLQAAAGWLRAKQRETWQIDDFFLRNSDFAKAALRDHLAAYYEDSLKTFPITSDLEADQNGDLRFAAILERIAPTTGVPSHDRLRRDVALVIMAKYFETCDIFEEPKYATP